MRAFSRRSNSRPASETSTTRAAVAGWSARKSRASPRTTDDESSFQELDRIVFVEHADVDQPAVLPTGQRRVLIVDSAMPCTLTPGVATGQCPKRDTPPREARLQTLADAREPAAERR